jgi:16S rRNA (adenine1518-N6/adenine1519-N6)-dimethyltransferase
MYTLKKSLGQHFLKDENVCKKDENVCKKIVAALQQCSFTNLLEIGPGGGALTKYLLAIPKIDFKAVELDSEKVDYLMANFAGKTGRR